MSDKPVIHIPGNPHLEFKIDDTPPPKTIFDKMREERLREQIWAKHLEELKEHLSRKHAYEILKLLMIEIETTLTPKGSCMCNYRYESCNICKSDPARDKVIKLCADMIDWVEKLEL